MLALRFAIEHPDSVGGLVLSGAVTCGEDLLAGHRVKKQKLGDHAESHFELAGKCIEGKCSEEEHAKFIELEMKTQARDDAVARTVSGDFTFVLPIVGKLQGDMLAFDVREGLTKIKVPTLVIATEKDSTPVEVSQKIHDAIRGSRLEVLENSAHWPMVAERDRFVSMVSSWLASLPG
jgi:pimeloyl-ACP methyl ester carboxylesterase